MLNRKENRVAGTICFEVLMPRKNTENYFCNFLCDIWKPDLRHLAMT